MLFFWSSNLKREVCLLNFLLRYFSQIWFSKKRIPSSKHQKEFKLLTTKTCHRAIKSHFPTWPFMLAASRISLKCWASSGPDELSPSENQPTISLRFMFRFAYTEIMRVTSLSWNSATFEKASVRNLIRLHVENTNLKDESLLKQRIRLASLGRCLWSRNLLSHAAHETQFHVSVWRLSQR